jgi:transcriptional antiterminator RfaH
MIRGPGGVIAGGSGWWDEMPYWSACRLQPHREALALHCLGCGFETYYPRLRNRRIRFGRTIENRPPLFPGYCFVLIELQWHAARWAPGILGLIMDGSRPARVPDAVIADLRARERNGVIHMPERELRPGNVIRVTRGPFRHLNGLYEGQAPHERVAVLLSLFGGHQRVLLPKADVAAL